MKTQRPEHISEFLWLWHPPSTALASLPQFTPSSTWPCLFPPPPPPFCPTLHSHSCHRYLYPFLHHVLHYPSFKIARLPFCSHIERCYNWWSLHLKTFVTFPSPLLSSLDWFPSLHWFTAYVTNEEDVLFVRSDPGRRQIMCCVAPLPTPCILHMTRTPLCLVYSFRSTLSHQTQGTCTSTLCFYHTLSPGSPPP